LWGGCDAQRILIQRHDFALVLMVLVLIGATVEGVRPAFTLLVAAARAAGAVLVRCARRRPVAVSPHSNNQRLTATLR
jgi:hypothetical protein